jgi:hypothetical protein
MTYRKGELSATMIDRDWPHQVALPASQSAGGGYKAIHTFCKDLSVYCFAEQEDADRFMQRFGGERFDPKQRGKGSNWARWKK